METVNKVVDAGYRVIWGEEADTATGSSNNQTTNQPSSLESVIDAGKKALWGTSGRTDSDDTTAHGEEPISGVRGLGTATDPYDAGNREEEERSANPVEPFRSMAAEQRDFDASEGTSSGTATSPTHGTASDTPDLLKTSVAGLQPDPSEPKNISKASSKLVVDPGPGQGLKHTSEPLQEESEKLAKDLQSGTEGKNNVSAAPVPIAADPVSKSSRDDSKSSSSGTSSSNGSRNEKQGQQKKTKSGKLEKVKNKLHIGSHSTKASK
ncbi:hypothetical protein BGW36DRAFT_380417 [Talaromyces proteolyticus]|uniref:Uncharacterized protein n=1 Tax=Talaromyces proteolyticus TaxID=1131652 RepID=A0AAD4KSQ8_9EURO|nr:uncharacterized protein BGW36DRAFT_380417 [Talaromyces proteolyticus]KAH8696195.1 hypothetical protein BGW36DRAFT_380417 [Talaromyces proteolyticus]